MIVTKRGTVQNVRQEANTLIRGTTGTCSECGTQVTFTDVGDFKINYEEYNSGVYWRCPECFSKHYRDVPPVVYRGVDDLNTHRILVFGSISLLFIVIALLFAV